MISNLRPAMVLPSAGPRPPRTPATFCSKWSRFGSRASIAEEPHFEHGLVAVDCARSIVEMNILMAKS